MPLAFVACTGSEARARYGDIPWLGDELIVVGDGGEVWVGPAAFLTCLWALVEWRAWSYRLAGPAFAPLASGSSAPVEPPHGIARLFEHDCADELPRQEGTRIPRASGTARVVVGSARLWLRGPRAGGTFPCSNTFQRLKPDLLDGRAWPLKELRAGRFPQPTSFSTRQLATP